MKKIVAIFVIWRLYLFAVAAISPVIIPTFGATFPYYQDRLIDTHLPQFIYSFGNFDGVHYLGIAKHAYAAQFTQAFFPLYPILIKAVSFITLGNLLIAALLVSNLSFLFGLLLFYKLIKKTYSESTAFWSSIFLLAFPTSFYFGAIYTEGLFFLLIVGCFYLQEIKKPFIAAIVGSLASFTRLIGALLSLSFISKDPRKLIYAAIVPVGLFVYMIYLGVVFKNPLYFLTSQTIFGQNRETESIVLLPQVLFRYLKILTTVQGQGFYVALFELSSTIFALVMLAIAFKKIKHSWVIFGLASVLLPTLTGTLASMPRYIIIAFPMYIVLSKIKNTILKTLIIVAFTLIGTVALIYYSQGYWVA